MSVALDSTARSLSDRVDALAAALRAAGVTPERSAALLASAAEAAMHALTLEALSEERRELAPQLEPPLALARHEQPRVSLAA